MKILENNSSQISETNMTSNEDKNDDEKIERKLSCTEDCALSPTYCYRNTENMYATIHVAHNTEDSHTSMPVKQDPTYNDVEHSMKLPCRFNKENTTKKHIQI